METDEIQEHMSLPVCENLGSKIEEEKKEGLDVSGSNLINNNGLPNINNWSFANTDIKDKFFADILGTSDNNNPINGVMLEKLLNDYKWNIEEKSRYDPKDLCDNLKKGLLNQPCIQNTSYFKFYQNNMCIWPECYKHMPSKGDYICHVLDEHKNDSEGLRQFEEQKKYTRVLEVLYTTNKIRLQLMEEHLHMNTTATSSSSVVSPLSPDSFSFDSNINKKDPNFTLPLSPFSTTNFDLTKSLLGDEKAVKSTKGSKRKYSCPNGGTKSSSRATRYDDSDFIKDREYYAMNDVRPPYTYANLIRQAIKESKSNQLTLNEIYQWFHESFVYFRRNQATWKNAVRHNLSLHKCFVRYEYNDRGAVWTVNDEEYFRRRPHNNISRSARTSPNRNNDGATPPLKAKASLNSSLDSSNADQMGLNANFGSLTDLDSNAFTEFILSKYYLPSIHSDVKKITLEKIKQENEAKDDVIKKDANEEKLPELLPEQNNVPEENFVDTPVAQKLNEIAQSTPPMDVSEKEDTVSKIVDCSLTNDDTVTREDDSTKITESECLSSNNNIVDTKKVDINSKCQEESLLEVVKKKPSMGEGVVDNPLNLTVPFGPCMFPQPRNQIPDHNSIVKTYEMISRMYPNLCQPGVCVPAFDGLSLTRSVGNYSQYLNSNIPLNTPAVSNRTVVGDKDDALNSPTSFTYNHLVIPRPPVGEGLPPVVGPSQQHFQIARKNLLPVSPNTSNSQVPAQSIRSVKQKATLKSFSTIFPQRPTIINPKPGDKFVLKVQPCPRKDDVIVNTTITQESTTTITKEKTPKT
uniref:Forkhead box protein P3 (inferred by orthology to a human protein) n=1 Tax=Strongyloides venezuelensis TaxID=75913 RepID=A0A0K0G2Y6_STRVS